MSVFYDNPDHSKKAHFCINLFIALKLSVGIRATDSVAKISPFVPVLEASVPSSHKAFCFPVPYVMPKLAESCIPVLRQALILQSVYLQLQ